MNTTVRQGLTSVPYLLDCWRLVESVKLRLYLCWKKYPV